MIIAIPSTQYCRHLELVMKTLSPSQLGALLERFSLRFRLPAEKIRFRHFLMAVRLPILLLSFLRIRSLVTHSKLLVLDRWVSRSDDRFDVLWIRTSFLEF